MSETLRTRIVIEARSWIDTPWHHQASLKGVGCDCIGLVRGVILALDLASPEIAQWDGCGYSRVPDGKVLKATFDEHLRPIPAAQMEPGDVVLLTVDVHPQHLGILTPYRRGGFAIVHAAANAHPPRVIETRLMLRRNLRLVAAYAMPGVA